MTATRVPALLAYRDRLARLHTSAAGGAARMDLADEALRTLDQVPLRLDDIVERLRNDPDVAGLSDRRRAEALADYLGIAIGAIDRALGAARDRPAVE